MKATTGALSSEATTKATDFLTSSIANGPAELRAGFTEMQRLFSKRLWFNLGEFLATFVCQPFFDAHPGLVQLYEQFVVHVESRLAPLCVALVAQRVSASFERASEAAHFLQAVSARLPQDSVEGQGALLLRFDAAASLLIAGDLDAGKAAVEAAERALDALAGAPDAAVSAAQHRAQAVFHRQLGHMSEFYALSLRYLSYRDVASLPAALRLPTATDVAVAALAGEDTYAFGELLTHPLAQYLEDSPRAWLVEMARACHRGDVERLDVVVAAHEAEVRGVPELGAALAKGLLREKAQVLSLVELVFQKQTQQQSRVAFEEIARGARVERARVDWLVMRALSLGLVRGYMDDLEQTLTVSYVQPRVLDVQQVQRMRDRMEEWSAKVHRTLVGVEQQ